jgi:Tfp pilus assembly protein PilV
MRNRPAVTLIEVLVSIFILAIGMLALLTLFPLGGLNMARALKDDRCAQAAQQAEGIANANNVRHDALPSPNAASGVTGQLGSGVPSTWQGPSRAVYADPIGLLQIGTTTALGGNVARVRLSFTPDRLTAMRWCSLQDDMTFDTNGRAGTGALASVKREGRYTWAYLIKRPRYQVPAIVDLTIVVYSGRNLQLAGGGETTFTIPNGGHVLGESTVRITYPAGAKPAIKAGSWVLDASTHNVNTDTANAMKYGPNHGFFYRVLSVSDTTTNNQVEIELETTPKAPIKTLVVMENVAEVFEKGSGWRP